MKLSDEMKVSLVTGVCVLALAIVSKYFLEAELDFVSQYGPVWIYMAYTLTRGKNQGSRICRSALFWSLLTALVTLSILLIYAL